MNNAEPGGLLAATGQAPAGGCSLCLPRAWRGNAGSGPRQRVFTVSGEAVNSLGLIESRCCGFGLTHPPPPPPLDNVSLKPLCKLTAFLCAEHWAAGGHGHGPRARRGLTCLGATWLPPALLLRTHPAPVPVPAGTERTDPLLKHGWQQNRMAEGGGMQKDAELWWRNTLRVPKSRFKGLNLKR